MDSLSHGRGFFRGGFRALVIKHGRKWHQVVWIDGSRVRAKRTKENIRLSPVAGYDLNKLARRMSRKRNSLGLPVSISKKAAGILREAA
jgi:hypothetical protein